MIISSLRINYNIILPEEIIVLIIHNNEYIEYKCPNISLSKGTIRRLQLDDLSNIVLVANYKEYNSYLNSIIDMTKYFNTKSYHILQFFKPNYLKMITPVESLEIAQYKLFKHYKKFKIKNKYYATQI